MKLCRKFRILPFIVFLSSISLSANAGFYFQYSGFYFTDTSDGDGLESAQQRNNLYFGATMKGGRFVIGQNINIWTKSEVNSTGGTAEEFSYTEMGPRFQFFMGQSLNAYISLAYNFYLNGSRNTTGTEEAVTGTSMQYALGYQLRAGKTVYWGFSLNYHSISLSKSESNNTTTDLSDGYTYVFPAFEFSLRFR